MCPRRAWRPSPLPPCTTAVSAPTPSPSPTLAPSWKCYGRRTNRDIASTGILNRLGEIVRLGQRTAGRGIAPYSGDLLFRRIAYGRLRPRRHPRPRSLSHGCPLARGDGRACSDPRGRTSPTDEAADPARSPGHGRLSPPDQWGGLPGQGTWWTSGHRRSGRYGVASRFV